MRWLIGAVMTLTCSSATAADLSPDSWPAAERAALERMEASPFPPTARTLQAQDGLVSATLSPVAVRAGVVALENGGTAADAAVTVALTQVATNLGAVVSYAGVVEVLYYEARTGQTHVLDGGWATYSGERSPLTIPSMDTSLITGGKAPAGVAEQGRKTLVPGFIAGLAATHQRFGRLPWADLFTPAVWYAENGVTVSPLLGAYFGMTAGQLSRTKEGRAFLSQSGRSLPRTGDRFVQPQVGHLLREVARSGPDAMYRGAWAREYVEIVRREGGAVTLADLAGYRPAWELPASVRFGDKVVLAPGGPNVSGRSILHAVSALDGQHPGEPYWVNPDAFVAFANALRAPVATPGHHSASVVVVDQWGNVAALVHSINAPMWGDTGIVVQGMPLSGAGGLYKARLPGMGPGAHVPSDMSPIVVLRGARPVLAIAAIGSSVVPETTRLAVGLLNDGNPSAWAAAPPLLIPFASADPSAEAIPAGAYSDEFQTVVQANGVKLQKEPAARVAALRGTAAFAVVTDGSWRTIETPKSMVFGGVQ
jgi:gamma-glutamyltranspeptidase/glutathione hydrolase